MKTTGWLFLAALLLAACGGPAPFECNASSCFGCCDASGVCQTGQQTGSCGASGSACVICGSAQQCDQGLCRSACAPKSCASAGAGCGQVDDGCGGTLQCGSCAAGQTCGAAGPNVCGTGTCTPKTCSGLSCGKLSDGCAAVLDCGGCAGGSFCGGGGPNLCGACQPKSCAALGKNCGPVADGCGGTVECGGCVAPNVCGGGGVTNVCGVGACQPKSCAQLGKNCGAVADGCGTTLSCGGCTGFATCGGAGVDNVCGASCTVSCPSGFSCNGGVCAGGSLQGLILNEVGLQVSGKVTVNGALPSRNGYCALTGNGTREVGRVTFVDGARGYSAQVSIPCSTADFSFSTLLPAGSYAVRVERGSYADESAVNLLPVDFLAIPQLAVGAAVSGLVLDELGHPVSGKVTVNGALPARNGYCGLTGNGTREIVRLTFADNARGYYGSLAIPCSTTDFSFATTLPPGTYELRLQRGSWADESGVNLLPVSYLAASQLAVGAAVTGLVLDEVGVGVGVSGKVTVNGALPTRNGYCTLTGNGTRQVARVSLVDSARGYSASVSIPCSTTDFSFSTLLPAGTYAVRVERGSYADESAVNLLPVAFLAVPALAVSAAVSNLVLNELGHPVSGKVLVNGALPVRNGYCSLTGNGAHEIGRLTFTDSAKGYYATVPIPCSTTDFSFATMLAPGTYEVRVHRGSWADESGVNLLAVGYLAASQLAVNAPVASLLLDEVGFPVSGKVTVNGALPTRNGYCSLTGNGTRQVARVRLVDSTRGYSASISIPCSTSDFSFSTLLPPGTYAVRVDRGSYADESAVNLLPVSVLVMPQLAVSAAVGNLVLNEAGQTVSGRVTVNGALPVRNGYCSLTGNGTREIVRITFADSTRGYYATVPILCSTTDFGFSTVLPSGTYDVRIQRGSWADESGLNVLPVSYLAVLRLGVP